MFTSLFVQSTVSPESLQFRHMADTHQSFSVALEVGMAPFAICMKWSTNGCLEGINLSTDAHEDQCNDWSTATGKTSKLRRRLELTVLFPTCRKKWFALCRFAFGFSGPPCLRHELNPSFIFTSFRVSHWQLQYVDGCNASSSCTSWQVKTNWESTRHSLSKLQNRAGSLHVYQPVESTAK